MSYWQLIFLQSKVNSGPYDGDKLPRQNWDWPQHTWFQERLRHLRKTRQVLGYKAKLSNETTSQPELKYQDRKVLGLAAFKEIGNGVSTMPDRQRGEVPGLH